MREVVSIHVGQCGNQIASAFWNLLLLEHENTPDDDPTLSSFFYYLPNPKYSSKGPSHVMKARALLIDMECGVLQETMRSSLGSLFDETQFIMDVSGAGNNYAHGFYGYGQQYHGHLLEGIRHNVEKCESLQAFFLTHSLGGGTGSGLGSYFLTVLADEFPKITKIATSVYPSEENDVITSPYNTILATRELITNADCVFPLSNSSLFAVHQLESPSKSDKAATATVSSAQSDVVISTKGGKGNSGLKKKKERGFDEINLIAARMLCNLTAPSRFHGEMNVDLNEIYTNLIPFPNLHFLTTALNLRYPNVTNQQRLRNDHSRNALQRAFLDIISHKGQLSGLSNLPGLGSIQHSCITASAFLARGKVILSDFIHCVNMAQRSMRFPIWNQDACKVSHCWCHIVSLNYLPLLQ
jgi:tubulin epsilon